MQLLGLSESTPRSESRWRALFWPTIRNEGDYDYVTRQGFWICFVVAVLTLILGMIAGQWAAAFFEAVFFFLAGLGVRERSRTAGLAAFTAYLLNALVLQRYSHNGFGVLRIIFLALLFANIRGNWLSAQWAKESIEPALPRLNQTFGDKLANRIPEILWPRARYVFYVLAAAEIVLLLVALFATTAPPELLNEKRPPIRVHRGAGRSRSVRYTCSSIHDTEPLSWSGFPLAWRTRVRKLLCSVPVRQEVGVGNLLAGRRLLQLDHRPLDSRIGYDS